jgi:hypothetical protein
MTNTTGQNAAEEKCPTCGCRKAPTSAPLWKEKPSWQFGEFERFCLKAAQLGLLLMAILLLVSGVLKVFGGAIMEGILCVGLASVAYGVSLAVSLVRERLLEEH